MPLLKPNHARDFRRSVMAFQRNMGSESVLSLISSSEGWKLCVISVIDAVSQAVTGCVSQLPGCRACHACNC
eukprot:scaffold144522_cov25-Prasinocladus_malaysianus.AAC.1